MINLVCQTLAVPFGYTADPSNMEEKDAQWHQFVCSNNHRSFISVRNGPMLPDLILDTPPPSPLRRAHSYHFTFPEKSTHKDWPHTPTPYLSSSLYSFPPTPTSLPPTPSTAGDEDLSVSPMSVERLQAVRRQILADPIAHRVPLPHNLPQLTWDVPLPSRTRSPQQELQIRQQETEEQRTCRTVGDDLRRVADKFHLDHAMVQRKNRGRNFGKNLDIVIPIALTRCLQVSLVAILCWRLLNKFG
ncbi:unnamed protein product [Meganyctiphanes norvegica]|uniref:Uncharacterized protein n=1 Tax=Meganyctiphanes norvegica TaxID=48144 RepID=A0AAV2Q0X6_MEGNR